MLRAKEKAKSVTPWNPGTQAVPLSPSKIYDKLWLTHTNVWNRPYV